MTNKLTLNERLDAMVREMKELDAKATPGRWITQEEDGDGKEMSLMGPMGSEDFDQLTLNYTMSSDNAELLCFLRNAVPDILAALQRLDEQEALIRKVQRDHTQMPDDCRTWMPCECPVCIFARAALSATPLPSKTGVKNG